MASICKTIKSRFQPTTFLIPPEGGGWHGLQHREKDEGERERGAGGRREIMSENVLVILIKWKCILSSSYWFVPEAECVFQRESVLCNAGLEAVFFTRGGCDYCSQQTIEIIIKKKNKAELQETMYSCQTGFSSGFNAAEPHVRIDDIWYAWGRERARHICKGLCLHGCFLSVNVCLCLCVSVCVWVSPLSAPFARADTNPARAARPHRSQTESNAFLSPSPPPPPTPPFILIWGS